MSNKHKRVYLESLFRTPNRRPSQNSLESMIAGVNTLPQPKTALERQIEKTFSQSFTKGLAASVYGGLVKLLTGNVDSALRWTCTVGDMLDSISVNPTCVSFINVEIQNNIASVSVGTIEMPYMYRENKIHRKTYYLPDIDIECNDVKTMTSVVNLMLNSYVRGFPKRVAMLASENCEFQGFSTTNDEKAMSFRISCDKLKDDMVNELILRGIDEPVFIRTQRFLFSTSACLYELRLQKWGNDG